MIINQNKTILSRLVFLLIFGATIVGIYLMGNSLSKSQDQVTDTVTEEGFLSSDTNKAVLVEFSDFQCPACAMYYPLVEKLRTELGDKLVVEYKYFPLKQIHKNAEISARAGEAARIQGKFWEMYDVLFEKQNEWADSSQALSLFTAYALSIGLDKDKFLSDIESNATYDKVSSDYKQGVRVDVTGTPTFFLNGKKINNPRSYDDFKLLIEQSIKQ